MSVVVPPVPPLQIFYENGVAPGAICCSLANQLVAYQKYYVGGPSTNAIPTIL